MVSSRRFLYSGWDLLAEFEAPGGTTLGALVRSYTWGLDLVGSLSASGGVGALLQITDHQSSISYLPTYDGNGNVASLLNADTGALEAAYEYDPFGQLLHAEGVYAKENPFRFSTKFQDEETGLICYGYRYYSASMGRFLSRDPIAEAGGLNLYAFAGNDGVNGVDYLGLGDDFARQLSRNRRFSNNLPGVFTITFRGGRASVRKPKPPQAAPPSSVDRDQPVRLGLSPTDKVAVLGGQADVIVIGGTVAVGAGRVVEGGVTLADALANAGIKGVTSTVGTTASVGILVLGGGILIIDVGSNAATADGEFRDTVPIGGVFILRSQSATSAIPRNDRPRIGFGEVIPEGVDPDLVDEYRAALLRGDTRAAIFLLNQIVNQTRGNSTEARIAATRLPDDALVVRGGINTPERIATGSGVVIEPGGKISGLSVQSAGGKSLNELASRGSVPHNQIGVTTVGAIRATGGDVVITPGNGFHAEVEGLTPEQMSQLLHIQPNPNPKP